MSNAEPHICLAPEPLQDTQTAGQRAALFNPSYWGQRADITIGFMGGTAALRQRVNDAARLWITEGGAKVTFTFWMGLDVDPTTANVRIAFKRNKGSWSHIGKYALNVPRDQPTMNLGWLDDDTDENELHRVVLHEFGHMLGLVHEHLQPEANISWNKEKIYAKYAEPPNSWSRAKTDANFFSKYDPSKVRRTDFDESSIMMYAVDKEFTTDGYSTEWNSSLSPMDKELIADVYR